MFGKQQIKCLLLAGLMLGFAVASAANLVENGDFEQGLVNWHVPNWGASVRTKPEIETKDLADAGQKALLLRSEPGKSASVYTKVKLPDGANKFRLSAQFRLCFKSIAWAQVYVECNGKMLGSVHKYNASETPWLSYKKEFEVPPGTERTVIVFCQLQKNANGFALFDNISIEAVEAAAAVPEAEAPQATGWHGAPAGGYNLIDRLPEPRRGAVWPVSENTFELRPGDGRKEAFAAWNCDSLQMPLDVLLGGPHKLAAEYRGGKLDVILRTQSILGVKIPSRKYTAAPVGEADGDGWKTLAVEFLAPAKNGYFWLELYAAGTVEVRNLRLERMVPPGDSVGLYRVKPGGEQGIFAGTDCAYLDYWFENSFAAAQEVTLAGEITDYFGRAIGKFSKTFELPPQKITACRVELPECETIGFYAVKSAWRHGESQQELSNSVVRVAEIPESPDPLFGMSCFGGGVENTPAMHLLGVGTRGLLFERSQIETGNNYWNFSPYDHHVAAHAANGINTIGMISMKIPGWVPGRFTAEIDARKKAGQMPYSDEYFKAMSKYAEALAAHYKGKIDQWSLCGEIDLLIAYNPYQREYYVKAVRAAATGIRRANPDAVITGISCAHCDAFKQPRYPVTRMLWDELHDVLDGISPDLYSDPNTYGPGLNPHNSEEEQLPEKLDELRGILAARNKSVMAIDERGPNILSVLPVDSPYDRSMANQIARNHVIMKSIPDLRHNLHFMWRPWRENEKAEWSMFRRESPRRCLAAYANVARRLNHAEFYKLHMLHANVPCYLFKRGERTVAALWYSSRNVDDTAKMVIPELSGGTFFDAQGWNIVPERMDGKTALTLGEAPVFFETTALPEKALAEFAAADIFAPELRGELVLRRLGFIEVLLENMTPAPLNATVDHKRELQLVPRQIAKLELPSTAELPEVEVATAKSRYVLRGNAKYYKVPQVAGFAELEKRAPLIVLDNLAHLNNVDVAANHLWTGADDLSAAVRMGYDAANFYLSVTVRDDIHINQYSGNSLWRGDAIQFAFDPNRDAAEKKMRGKSGLFDDDLNFVAALGKNGPELYCHQAGAAEFSDKLSPAKPEIVRDEARKTTSYRIKLPWLYLKPLTPVPGKVTGFNIIVLDADRAGQNPDYWLQLTPGIAGGQAPELFHGIVFEQ